MARKFKITGCLLTAAGLACGLGCETQRSQVRPDPADPLPAATAPDSASTHNRPAVEQVSFRQEPEVASTVVTAPTIPGLADDVPSPSRLETLADFENLAVTSNPQLRRLQQEAAAEWAKAQYASKLPDPTVSTMFFTPPMHFDPDRQIADLQVMQMIPWLGRLQAQAQRAHMEALVAATLYQAERLRVIGDLRAAWYKLYVLNKQIETTQADQAQLETLITTANARVRTGDAQPGDLLMATLELSSLQEQLLTYRQQFAAATAELNRLAGRDAAAPVTAPATIDIELPQWDFELLRSTANQMQPELNAARLRTAATRWGIEVARLQRRPDLTFGVGLMVMDAPGATTPNAGMDSWTLGVSANIPVWHRQYDAMVAEASRRHYAAHASEDEVAQQLDALLYDLWQQARAGQQTIELYEQTILPQARQTFEADQQSLANNTVSFDRVIRDYRTLLSLQLGYHRALGQLATTLSRIRQTIGVDLVEEP